MDEIEKHMETLNEEAGSFSNLNKWSRGYLVGIRVHESILRNQHLIELNQLNC